MTNTLIDTMQRAGADLTDLGAPWALIGGIAVSTRTEPRFTRDVDFAVVVADDQAAERIVREMRHRGWYDRMILEHSTRERLSTVRLARDDDAAGVVVDVLFASSGIEAEIVGAAEELEIIESVIAPVARIGHLIALKLLARTDGRPQDNMDLTNLRAVASNDDLVDARSAIRLISERGFDRGRDLLSDLDQLIG